MLSILPHSREIDGLDMQTITRILFAAVLLCLLLPLAAGNRRHLRVHPRGRNGHAVTVRLRRSGTNHPAHHPVRPAPAAVLPPDEDDDSDRLRLAHTNAPPAASPLPEKASLPRASEMHRARPLAPDRPLYQTLGILLI